LSVWAFFSNLGKKRKKKKKKKQEKEKEKKKGNVFHKLCSCVLGSARTGLIFTGLQEGAQPGGGG